MTQTRNPCRDEFNRGLEARRAYPLHLGAYKLRESRDRFLRVTDTICLIAAWRRHERGAQNQLLGSCTRDSAARWLKQRPREIAFDLGYYVVPAVKALTGDDVPKDLVQSCFKAVSSETIRIVDECDSVCATLRTHGVRSEYTLMKSHGSMVRPLAGAAIGLIDSTIARVQLWL